MGDTVNVKDLPQFLKDCLKAIGYRKHKAIVYLSTNCFVHGTNWSGGSRNEYTTFNRNGDIDGHPREGGNWMNPQPVTVEFTKSTPLCIEAGPFCGKPGTAFIYIHPRFAQTIGIAPIGYTFTAQELEDWTL